MAVVSVLVILFAISAFFSNIIASNISKHKDISHNERVLTLQQTADLINTWYKTNAFSIDSNSDIVPPPSISGRWGMTVLMTGRIDCSSGVKGHIYAVVIPGPNGVETTIDDRGNITYGKYDLVEVVDGCLIQQDMVSRSKQIASALTASLENYHRSRAAQDHSPTAKNFFVDSSCNGWGDIPCANDGRNNANILSPYLGVKQKDYTDAYGHVMHFDNASSNVNLLTPPFTARVGFDTPWGTTIWTIAVSR